MGCPHPGIECEDCAECARGDSCSLAQIVMEEEEALRSGDVASWEWQALHEKGAGQ